MPEPAKSDSYPVVKILPLWMRRQRLKAAVRACDNPGLVFSEGIVGPGRAFFDAVCQEGCGCRADQVCRPSPATSHARYLLVKEA